MQEIHTYYQVVKYGLNYAKSAKYGLDHVSTLCRTVTYGFYIIGENHYETSIEILKTIKYIKFPFSVANQFSNLINSVDIINTIRPSTKLVSKIIGISINKTTETKLVQCILETIANTALVPLMFTQPVILTTCAIMTLTLTAGTVSCYLEKQINDNTNKIFQDETSPTMIDIGNKCYLVYQDSHESSSSSIYTKMTFAISKVVAMTPLLHKFGTLIVTFAHTATAPATTLLKIVPSILTINCLYYNIKDGFNVLFTNSNQDKIKDLDLKTDSNKTETTKIIDDDIDDDIVVFSYTELRDTLYNDPMKWLEDYISIIITKHLPYQIIATLVTQFTKSNIDNTLSSQQLINISVMVEFLSKFNQQLNVTTIVNQENTATVFNPEKITNFMFEIYEKSEDVIKDVIEDVIKYNALYFDIKHPDIVNTYYDSNHNSNHSSNNDNEYFNT